MFLRVLWANGEWMRNSSLLTSSPKHRGQPGLVIGVCRWGRGAVFQHRAPNLQSLMLSPGRWYQKWVGFLDTQQVSWALLGGRKGSHLFYMLEFWPGTKRWPKRSVITGGCNNTQESAERATRNNRRLANKSSSNRGNGGRENVVEKLTVSFSISFSQKLPCGTLSLGRGTGTENFYFVFVREP